MPRPSRKSQYTVIEERSLYVILNRFTKEFFVDYALSRNIRSAYLRHCSCSRRQTEAMIARMKEAGTRPCCFRLADMACTKVEAYRAVIGWTRVFVDQGFISLDHGNMAEYIQDLFGYAKLVYEQNKDVNIAELCACKNCLVPVFKKQPCEMLVPDAQMTKEQTEKRQGSIQTPYRKQLQFSVSEEEKELIQSIAKLTGRSVSGYVREVALNVHTHSYNDKEFIQEHTQELAALRHSVGQLVYTIVKTEEWYPIELETIRELLEETNVSEKDFLARMEIHLKSTRKARSKEIGKLIRERLKQLEKK